MRNQLLDRSTTTPAAHARPSSRGPEGGIRQFRVSVSGRIGAPPVQVYAVIADYKEHHPRIVPPEYFRRLDVLEGGVGAGTRTQIEMRVLGVTRVFEQVVTEPQPGRVLMETNQDGSAVTTFTVQPAGTYAATQLTITTDITTRPGFAGFVERLVTSAMLRRIYQKEFARLAEYVDHRAHFGLVEESLPWLRSNSCR